ncbi:hypothetical protein CKO44_18395 [Rubrivivax gelatinosus]|uniref:Uncharacterized protein n=2 Tax=Rubrivivax gelatinosus TaxID=28068 RepID=A0ABS1DSH7_RUBGE|nr:hypothetical protein [Rubrivivax gelatinosus]MBK1712081.1 hypothetical protein [Rubrivivax gelatinosus]MBZ8143428.1 hypothetical protein [Rubrivivax gelatinosus]
MAGNNGAAPRLRARILCWLLRIAAVTVPLGYYAALLLARDWRPAWYVDEHFREWNLVVACVLALVFFAGLATIPRRALRYTSIAVCAWIFVSYQQMSWGLDRPPYVSTLRLPSGQWLALESIDFGATTSGDLYLWRLSPAGPLHRLGKPLAHHEGAGRGTLRLEGDGVVVARIEFYSGAVVEQRIAIEH